MSKLDKTDYNLEQKVAFVHGYAYAQAESMKREGCFVDLTINQLTSLILKETLKDK